MNASPQRSQFIRDPFRQPGCRRALAFKGHRDASRPLVALYVVAYSGSIPTMLTADGSSDNRRNAPQV